MARDRAHARAVVEAGRLGADAELAELPIGMAWIRRPFAALVGDGLAARVSGVGHLCPLP